jgi:hypothetical protein
LRSKTAPACFAAFAILAAILATPAVARAYRPFDGTDADVAPPGVFELELGSGYASGRGIAPSFTLPAVVLNQGIVPNFELVLDVANELGARRLTVAPTAQIVDTDVRLKWLVRRGCLQGLGGASVATEFGPLIPTATGERVGAIANVIVSERAASWTFHANVGGALTRDTLPAIIGTLILESPESLRARPVAELLFERDFGGSTTASLLLGTIWTVSEALALDVGTRGALVDGRAVEEIRVGLTWAIPIWHVARGGEPAGPIGFLAL